MYKSIDLLVVLTDDKYYGLQVLSTGCTKKNLNFEFFDIVSNHIKFLGCFFWFVKNVFSLVNK